MTLNPKKGWIGAEDPLWYKDALIYQLHVKAFGDSSQDGIGDFRGLIERLDYLQELGVDTLWLMPFYPSPCAMTATTFPIIRTSIPITARWPIFGLSSAQPTRGVSRSSPNW
jgi:hypothetical protein